MYNIQTLNEIAACGTDLFDKAKYAVAKDCQNPDAVMVRSAAMHDTPLGDNLIAIARAGAGVNNIPIPQCSEKGICVFNTPGANANAVKELVLAGLLLSSRRIPDALDWAKTLKGKGADVPALVEKGKGQFGGPEVKGKTLGLIGLGAIGALVANAAIKLGMKVIGYDPFLSVTSALGLDNHCKLVNDINEIYSSSDYISLHAPFNKETKGSVNSDAIAKMKDNVRILNFARAELVDSDSMLKALESGKVYSYVVDFPTDEMLGAKNVIAIPHLGASTPESEDNCAVMAAEELIEYIEYGNIKNSVNLPDAEMNATGTKVCIIHKNVPAVIAAVTNTFGSAGNNIDNMLNKSKGDMGYMLLDVSGSVSDDIISKLSALDNVIRVRII